LSHPQAPDIPWLRSAAECFEPWLARGVELFAEHGRHPILTQVYPFFKELGFNEILRQFNKYQASQLLRSMDIAGIETSVVCAIEPFFETLDILKTLEPFGERFAVFCAVDPQASDCFERLAYYAASNQVAGLKIHPPLVGPTPTSDRMFELVEFAAGHHWPVIIHAGTFPFPLLEGTDRVRDLEPVIQAFPEVPMVLAHIGWDQAADVLRLGARYSNVFTDTSWQSGTVIREAISALGVERVLFGSDFPLFHQGRARDILQSALRPNEVAPVGYENARKLLNRASGLRSLTE
jgi:predicted TIM-barrel fold metal-dependent hydrolase